MESNKYVANLGNAGTSQASMRFGNAGTSQISLKYGLKFQQKNIELEPMPKSSILPWQLFTRDFEGQDLEVTEELV